MSKNIPLSGIIPTEDVKISSICFDNYINHEASGDFTLPDYLPQIKKIVSVSSAVVPSGKFISDNGASNTLVEFGGAVNYTIIYMDEKNELAGAAISLDYESNTAIPSPISAVSVDTHADNNSCRVTGPRKLSMKTRLRSRVSAFAEKSLAERVINCVNAADELALERLTQQYQTVLRKTASLKDLHVSDTFDSVTANSELRPIYCGGIVHVKDSHAENDVISVSGDIIVKCLYSIGTDTIQIKSTEKSIPFSESIDCEGVNDKYSVCACGRGIGLTVSNDETAGTLVFDMAFELECEAMTNSPVSVTSDIYSTSNECTAKYKETDIFTAVRCNDGNLTVNESVKRQNNSPSEIIDIIGDASVDKIELINGKLTATGNCGFKIIMVSKNKGGEGNSAPEYSCEDYSIPFKYECDAGKNNAGEIVWRALCDMYEVSAKLDSDKITVNAELALSVSALKKERITHLDSAELNKSVIYSRDDASITVIYPEPSDTVWTIAKAHHLPQSAVDLSEDSGIVIV